MSSEIICPYCGEKWILSTSNITGCCDTERVLRGYTPLPKEDAIIVVDIPRGASNKLRRQVLCSRVKSKIDWYNPPPNHVFMAIVCRCKVMYQFRTVQEVPLMNYKCPNCEQLLIRWDETCL